MIKNYITTQKHSSVFTKIVYTILFAVFLILLLLISKHKYLLFHSFIEIFSVIISCCVFVLSTFTYNKEKNAFSILGLGYLIVGIIDLLHTLSYQGMNIFDSEIYYANQLWICARFIESITICIFLVQIKKLFFHFKIYICIYLGYLLFVFATVFFFKNFPICYIKDQGQTSFKIFSEYIICLILGMALLILHTKKYIDNKKIRQYFFLSIVITILSEFCFTLYTDNYGFLNVVGHLFKLISFYYIYKSILIVNVQDPLAIIFEELNIKEQKILKLLADLEVEKNAALESSITDGLTGIYNRRYFNEIIIDKYNTGKREQRDFSLLMIDIDFFKNYNDQYGHVCGDTCLKQVAKTLQLVLNRATDTVARYGGEEFVVILENTNKSGAVLVANKMCKAVRDLRIEHVKSECSQYVTISIGGFTITDYTIERIDNIVTLTDKALYKAKCNGRNRVEFHEFQEANCASDKVERI